MQIVEDMVRNGISIHTLRMEGDDKLHPSDDSEQISIHTLRMEGDCPVFRWAANNTKFQSTPSAWRVTGNGSIQRFAIRRISIHTLRVEGDSARTRPAQYDGISIHTLRMEGDWLKPRSHLKPQISIHTLRMEGDGKRVF